MQLKRISIYAIKLCWRKMREAQLGGDMSAVVPSLFRGARIRTTRTRRWDIVQIRPSKIPGRFTLWVSIDGEITPVPLRIPRQFYLHFKTPPRDELFRMEYYQLERVTRHLLRDIPCNNLYKVVIKEDVYEDI
jgi:DNA polymerase epsilon subunit 1